MPDGVEADCARCVACAAAELWLWYGFQNFPPVTSAIYLYAQCLKGELGGIMLLIINADRHHSIKLNLPTASERYTLTAEKLEDSTVELNGKPLRLTSSGDLPPVVGEPVKAGRVSFAPISITFLTIAKAGNANCQ